MTYSEKSIENFLEQLEFDSDFYGVLTNSELLEFTKDFLSSYNIEITEGNSELLEFTKDFLSSYNIKINEGCDYRNDQNQSGPYYCDLASEWADSQVDIYNSDLWEKAPKFQWWNEDALNEF